MAPRPSLQEVGPEQITREPRAVGELERFAEEGDRRRCARELVATDSQPETHVRLWRPRERSGTPQHRLDFRALLGGDAGREERGIYSELLRKPGDGRVC